MAVVSGHVGSVSAVNTSCETSRQISWWTAEIPAEKESKFRQSVTDYLANILNGQGNESRFLMLFFVGKLILKQATCVSWKHVVITIERYYYSGTGYRYNQPRRRRRRRRAHHIICPWQDRVHSEIGLDSIEVAMTTQSCNNLGKLRLITTHFVLLRNMCFAGCFNFGCECRRFCEYVCTMKDTENGLVIYSIQTAYWH